MLVDRVEHALQNLQWTKQSQRPVDAIRQLKNTYLVIIRASDRGGRLGAMPLAGRAVVDDSRGLRVLPAPDALKDGLLVRDKLAEPRACTPNNDNESAARFDSGQTDSSAGSLNAPFSILSLTSSTAVLASSSESCPPAWPSASFATWFWISFLSHFCASHLSEALKGGPRGCW